MPFHIGIFRSDDERPITKAKAKAGADALTKVRVHRPDLLSAASDGTLSALPNVGADMAWKPSERDPNVAYWITAADLGSKAIVKCESQGGARSIAESVRLWCEKNLCHLVDSKAFSFVVQEWEDPIV